MHQNGTFSASQAVQFTHKYVVIVDTDIGDDIDDALALALVLNSPEIELKGVTTVFGNTQQRARLAAHLLNVYGRNDIPVAAGTGTPLLQRHRPSGVPQAAIVHRSEVFPAISSLSGPELIIQTALAHSGQLILLCIGPLTNIATALLLEPRSFMAIRNIVVMGGTSGMPFPEWNIRSDAKAAQIVLGAGIPITLLGWNITTRCQMRISDRELLRASTTPQAQLLNTLLQVWQRHRPRWHPELPYLHDPLAVMALCKPELLLFEEMTARVFVHGPLTGYMVPRTMDGPLVHAAIDIQVEQARAWIMQRLLTPTLQSKAT
jgi:inosine-uridine nucleoside N-ribohydrolase